MSLSVEELDQTVKSFFEGRGDVVSPSFPLFQAVLDEMVLLTT